MAMTRYLLASSATLALAGLGWLAVRVAQRHAERDYWRQVALEYGCN